MSYEVQIVADSISPNGSRITTFQLKYPRMIHAEFMTHRMFSRNASSTRAIPTAKMIEWIERDPAMPVYWGKNQKGMQATEELPPEVVKECEWAWLKARDQAVIVAKGLMADGVHKQIASRILEPWAHINVVVTATNFDNFFALRCHKAAMPEIQMLAVQMARAYRDHTPVRNKIFEWHLPYVTADELGALQELRVKAIDSGNSAADQAEYDEGQRLLKLSVARCARVSYLTFEGKTPDPEADIKLHDTLLGNGHWSPFEHQARPFYDTDQRSGNFRGWLQYRQTLRIQCHEEFDFTTLDQFGDRDFIV